ADASEHVRQADVSPFGWPDQMNGSEQAFRTGPALKGNGQLLGDSPWSVWGIIAMHLISYLLPVAMVSEANIVGTAAMLEAGPSSWYEFFPDKVGNIRLQDARVVIGWVPNILFWLGIAFYVRALRARMWHFKAIAGFISLL